jgi:hypothetical protein
MIALQISCVNEDVPGRLIFPTFQLAAWSINTSSSDVRSRPDPYNINYTFAIRPHNPISLHPKKTQ